MSFSLRKYANMLQYRSHRSLPRPIDTQQSEVVSDTHFKLCENCEETRLAIVMSILIMSQLHDLTIC